MADDALKVLTDANVHPLYIAGYADGVAAERERCARIADPHSECERDCGDVIANAIRRCPA